VSSGLLFPLLLTLSLDGGNASGDRSATQAIGEAGAFRRQPGKRRRWRKRRLQAKEPTGLVRLPFKGKVLARGTRQPLGRGTVSIAVGDGTRASGETGPTAALFWKSCPAQHQLRVQCPGFVPATRQVTIAADHRGLRGATRAAH
jgi:hypothetical protein